MPVRKPPAEAGEPRAFTLVELLAVIAIIGLLAGLLLPAVQRARESGRRAACANKLAQLAKACLQYANSNGAYPAAFTSKNFDAVPMSVYAGTCAGGFNGSLTGTAGFRNDQSPSWTVAILPFLGQQPRFDSFRPWGSGNGYDGVYGGSWGTWNRDLAYTPNNAYQCPSDPVSDSTETNTNYFAVSGGGAWAAPPAGKSPRDGYAWFSANSQNIYNNGVMHINGRVTEGAILDGTSNTFMLGETRYQWVYRSEVAWAAFTNNAFYVGRVSRPSWAAGARGWDCPSNGNMLLQASTQASTSQFGINVSGCTDMLKAPPLMDNASNCGNPGGSMVSSFGSFHPGGCHFALADGSVKFVNETIEFRSSTTQPLGLYNRLGVKADGVLMSGLPW